MPYLARVDEARRYTNFGPLVTELEAAFAERHRMPDATRPSVVTLTNATLGLQLALQALRLPPDASVLVPAFTFPASVAAIVNSALTPVVCDVDAESWLLTPDIARRAAVSKRIDAVMPVATFGSAQPCDLWDRFVEETGIPVLIDAAGAFGNQSAGRKTHVVLSLHATKALGAGEGGALLSFDVELAQQVRRLSNFGIDVDTSLIHRAGTNAKMSEYHAAVALAALASWPRTAQQRIRLHQRYLNMLQSQCPPLRFQRRAEDGIYSILSVLLPPGYSAADASALCSSRSIETRRWYWPLILEHPAFAHLDTSGPLDTVRVLGDHLIGLPFHNFLRDDDLESVASGLSAFLTDRQR